MSYNAVPNFSQSIVEKGLTNRAWYAFFQNLFKGLAPSSTVPVVVGGSPFTYVADQRGFMIVQGGTVSLIQFSRDGATNYSTGQTSGCVPLSAQDRLIVTFSGTPSMTFVPQ